MSLDVLNRMKSALQSRFDWIQQLSTTEGCELTDSLQQSIILHHFTDDNESASTLILQAAREYTTTKSSHPHDAKESFNATLASFVNFIERCSGLLCRDLDEVGHKLTSHFIQ